MPGFESEPLPAESVARILGHVNTEKKILYLGCLEPGQTTTAASIYSMLDDSNAFGLIEPYPGMVSAHTSMIREYFSAFPSSVCQVESCQSDSEGVLNSTEITLNPRATELMQGLGGMLLGLSFDSSKSVRSIVGETRTFRAEEHVHKNSSIENRMVVAYLLLANCARRRSLNLKQLYKLAKPFGTVHSAVHTHLDRLMEAGLVERYKYKPPKRRSEFRYRVAPDNGHMAPVDILSQFLTIVAKTSVLDADSLEQGQKTLLELMQNSDILPFFMKRSFANTNHTGKTYKRAKNSNGVKSR